MPNIKSAKKRVLVIEKKTLINQMHKTALKTAIKKFNEDVESKNVEEAMLELDFFIDSSLTLGVNEITIIHGKGTGTLRTAVHQTLRKNRFVKSFRFYHRGTEYHL